MIDRFKIVTDISNNYFTDNTIAIGTSKPSSGTWNVSDIVVSLTQSDGIWGWVCITAGSPGVWKTISDSEKIGILANLKTNAKDNVVNAINEICNNIVTVRESIVESIGDVISTDDNFFEIVDGINALLIVFREVVVEKGLSIRGDETYKELIELLKGSDINLGGGSGDDWVEVNKISVLSATMTTPRTDLVAEYYNGNIYIFSGEYNLGFYTSPLVSRYEVATNKYVDQHTTMYGYGTDESYNSFLRVGAMSSIIGDTIYITGGYTDVQNIENTKKREVMKYNIDSNSWAMGTESNYYFIDTQLAKINNMLYAVGGTYDSMDGSFGGYGQFYDTVSDTWTDITQNTRIGTNTAVAADHEHNMIYTLSIQLFYGYDVSTSTWTTQGTLISSPYPLQFSKAFYNHGGIYIVGGYNTAFDSTGPSNKIYRYDIATNSWTQKSTLKQAVSRFGLAYDIDNDTVYAVGGEYIKSGEDAIYDKIQKYEV